MSRAARRLGLRIATGLLVVAALFAGATLVPIRVYKPTCSAAPRSILGAPARIDGPLRPEYATLLTRAMRREGFRYWRIGDTILVPLLPIFDGNHVVGAWTDFVNNTEWRIASSILNGYTAHGCAPPPPAVRRLYTDITGTCGVPPERRPDGRVVYPVGVQVTNDCDLFRAAAIRIEDMPQPLPVLDGFSSYRDQRTGRPATGPAPQRP